MKVFSTALLVMTCAEAVLAAPTPQAAAKKNVAARDSGKGSPGNIATAALDLAKSIPFEPWEIAPAAVKLAGAITSTSTHGAVDFRKRDDTDSASASAERRDIISSASKAFAQAVGGGDESAIQKSILDFINVVGPAQSSSSGSGGGSGSASNSRDNLSSDSTGTNSPAKRQESTSDAVMNVVKSAVSMNSVDATKSIVQLLSAVAGDAI